MGIINYLVITRHYSLGVQGINNRVKLDSGHPYEHPRYGQLTAVKKRIC